MLSILGLILMYAGMFSVYTGAKQNYSFTGTLNNLTSTTSIFTSGGGWLLIGVLAIVAGTVLILMNAFKKDKKSY